MSFSPRTGYTDRELMLACGQCIGCRLERSRQWAVRCMHEASMHDQCCFVTLTYSQAALPPSGSLDRTAFPRFIRRLRKHFRGRKLKYFMCGEYGELLARPHYHAIIFGVDFPDKILWRTTCDNHKLWRSPQLERLWPLGFSAIGAVSFETSAYVARYCLKKVTGDQAAEHYRGLVPEFMTCSKGIGELWLAKYRDETYRDDTVVMRGREMRPPRYYDKKHAEACAHRHRRIELARIRAGAEHAGERTPERLAVREECKRAELAQLKRSL